VTVCECERLRLRRLTTADAAFMLELLNDAAFRAQVGDRGVRTLEDARRYIESGALASYARDGFGLWLIELRESGTAAGICGLLRRDVHPDVELGFALLPAFRGRGYALEAARATLELAVGSFALRRITALSAPGNEPSIRILEKLGLHFERMVEFPQHGGRSRLFARELPAA
jgi:[ribosomal protein S5]-alanine N-acetyltransferase